MNEIWKDVVDYEGLYQVSNLGRVRSCSRVADVLGSNQFGRCFTEKHIVGKILKPCEYNGYYCVSLYKNGKMKLAKIHRLVASAFLGKSDLTVNHKNGVKTDNSIVNLEYLTSAENTHHAILTGLRSSDGENNPRHKVTKSDVVNIRIRKLNGENKNSVYSDYSTIISSVTFEKIWYNMTWKSVIV
jgi:hypothetical protein